MFTVAQGAVLNLSGVSPNNTLEGTFTGAGQGTVLFDSGFLSTGPQGATFNFPAGLFQWTGGTIDNTGGLTNQGTITLAGSNDLTFGPGALDNTGTIIQTGGEFSLDPNTTLLNEAGGLYNLETGANLNDNMANGGGVNPVLANAGTFEESAGGSTTMTWDLDNTGTFEVDSGTLTQNGNLLEAVSLALTGGTWVVSGGAALTLQQPGNLSINQADVTLSGAGSSFTNLSALSSNSGTLTLTSGATLSAARASRTRVAHDRAGQHALRHRQIQPNRRRHPRRATWRRSRRRTVRPTGRHRLGDARRHAPGQNR